MADLNITLQASTYSPIPSSGLGSSFCRPKEQRGTAGSARFPHRQHTFRGWMEPDAQCYYREPFTIKAHGACHPWRPPQLQVPSQRCTYYRFSFITCFACSGCKRRFQQPGRCSCDQIIGGLLVGLWTLAQQYPLQDTLSM